MSFPNKDKWNSWSLEVGSRKQLILSCLDSVVAISEAPVANLQEIFIYFLDNPLGVV